MARSLESLKGSVLQTKDGEIGHVEEFYFDDDDWTVRYLVVDTGNWASGKKVLISPISIEEVSVAGGSILVSLTRDQVQRSPGVDTKLPISRQWEKSFHDFYHWPYYWVGSSIWGTSPFPSGAVGRRFLSKFSSGSGDRDSHLRSAQTVKGYGIEATDHHFGKVDDFIVDEKSWSIRYLVIETNWLWSNKSVIISPEWVTSISWTDRKIRVNLTKEIIKNSPEYRSDSPVNRGYEEQLYDYYGRPTYWSDNTSQKFEELGEKRPDLPDHLIF